MNEDIYIYIYIYPSFGNIPLNAESDVFAGMEKRYFKLLHLRKTYGSPSRASLYRSSDSLAVPRLRYAFTFCMEITHYSQYSKLVL